MTDPPLWQHNFAQDDGRCRCGVVFLDATGGCPVPPGSPHRIRCLSCTATPPGVPDPHTGKWLTGTGGHHTIWAKNPEQATVFPTLKDAENHARTLPGFTVELVAVAA